jgi:hypothetical protein
MLPSFWLASSLLVNRTPFTVVQVKLYGELILIVAYLTGKRAESLMSNLVNNFAINPMKQSNKDIQLEAPPPRPQGRFAALATEAPNAHCFAARYHARTFNL